MIIQVKDRFINMNNIECIRIQTEYDTSRYKDNSTQLRIWRLDRETRATYLDTEVTHLEAEDLVEKYIQQIADQVKEHQPCL